MPSNTITEKVLKKLQNGEAGTLSSEAMTTAMLYTAEKWPALKTSGIITPEGSAAHPFTPIFILQFFHDKKMDISILSKQVDICLGSSLDMVVCPPEGQSDSEKSNVNRIANFPFAEALMARIIERDPKKTHIWASSAARLLAILEDENKPLTDPMRAEFFEAAYSWFSKTIHAKKDGLKPALDGLARLLFNHHPEDSDGAKSEAIHLFQKAAELGYLDSMLVLAGIKMDQGFLNADEERRSLEALALGRVKNPQSWEDVQRQFPALTLPDPAPAPAPPGP